jgi:uncharacterized membrane protein YeaQ/YmgE (transglycosylase-associated protein family)
MEAQPMDIINLLIQLLSGAIGGNVAGDLSRSGGLGAPANTLSGAVGGGIGGQILSALLGLATARTAPAPSTFQASSASSWPAGSAAAC